MHAYPHRKRKKRWIYRILSLACAYSSAPAACPGPRQVTPPALYIILLLYMIHALPCHHPQLIINNILLNPIIRTRNPVQLSYHCRYGDSVAKLRSIFILPLLINLVVRLMLNCCWLGPMDVDMHTRTACSPSQGGVALRNVGDREKPTLCLVKKRKNTMVRTKSAPVRSPLLSRSRV